jgi:outer membrane protein assembly factor BamB
MGACGPLLADSGVIRSAADSDRFRPAGCQNRNRPQRTGGTPAATSNRSTGPAERLEILATSQLRRGLLATLLLCAACASTPPIDRPLLPHAPNVSIDIDWRLELVDQGFWSYAPTELGEVTIDHATRTAYVGTSSGVMAAVDTDVGRLRWTFDVGEPVDGGATVDDGTLYFGASDGNLYAIDAGGGSLLWSFQAGGNLDGRPAVTEDYVIFANGHGVVMCLDRETGVPLWSSEDDDPVLRVTRGLYPPVKGQSSPLVVDDIVYVGYPSGRISAIQLATGDQLWTTDLGGEESRHTDVDEQPILVGDRLIAMSFTGGLHALDLASGTVIWSSDLVGGTRPVVYGDSILTTSVDGRYISYSVADGSIQFSLLLDDRAPARIHLSGDYALLPTTRGGLYVLDAGSPHIFAYFRPTAGFASVAVMNRGGVVGFDNRGVLHGLRLRIR